MTSATYLLYFELPTQPPMKGCIQLVALTGEDVAK